MAQPAINPTPAFISEGGLVASRALNEPLENGYVKLEAAPDGSGSTTSDESGDTTYLNPPTYFNEALNDAERLLKYAAERGVCVDAQTRDYVVRARAETG